MRACIVTCGGLCPGINTVIREIVCGLSYMYNVHDILGIQVTSALMACLTIVVFGGSFLLIAQFIFFFCSTFGWRTSREVTEASILKIP